MNFDRAPARASARSSNLPATLALCLLAACALPVAAADLPPAAAGAVDFERDVAPLLERCQPCHSAAMQMSGLRLDRGADALKGGYSGPVIVPGDSAGSALILRVAGEGKAQRMPPAGPPLTAEEIGKLRAWIDAGAKFPTVDPAPDDAVETRSGHWSFQPVRRPSPPAVSRRQWVRNPLDAFVLARLEQQGIAPSPEADKITLLRRVSFDLTGLPPSPGEVAAFLDDNRPDAYERAVERLLDSPHYGEKWARHWLDAARYADSDGYEKDLARPFAWRYRNWVIDALNHDMPFDRFSIEQIAGDLLPDAAVDQLVAVGFHRNTLTNREGGIDREELRVEQAIDRINTIGSIWLGLTVGCAQCHDHKYDPISQKEYYQLYAFLSSIEEVDVDAPMPGELGPFLASYPEYRAKRDRMLEEHNVGPLMAEWEPKVRLAAKNQGQYGGDWDLAWTVLWNDERKILFTDPEQRTDKERDKLTDHFLEWYSAVVTKERYDELGFKALRERLAELRGQYPFLTQAQSVVDQPEPRATHILLRGDFRSHGLEVQPDTLAVLPPLEAGERPNRLDLARWLFKPENPLVARVTVNRIWQRYFGTGLVRTTEDFGTQGEKPSHPDLLDWLASEFVAHGWSLKQLHRTIVTSATYRQSSHARPDVADVDPDNRLLARQSRLRLPAELIRDNVLAVSGLLNPEVGGPSIRPPQPAGVSEITYGTFGSWTDDTGPKRYRRGLYIHFQRSSPYPLLMNFDAPDAAVTCTRRRVSNTPLQALNLLNDPVFLEAARALAVGVCMTPAGDDAARLDHLFQRALGRRPSPREREWLLEYLEKQMDVFDSEPESVAALASFPTPGVEPRRLAAWAGLARLVLNLDEFITRE